MFFIDTNVFLYAAGAEHPLREPCQRILQDTVSGNGEGNTSTEIVQEILYVLTRRGLRDKALVLAEEVLNLFPELLPITKKDMQLALGLLEDQSQVSVRDAIHIATMRNNGITQIVSADHHFDGISEVQRIDPADWQNR